MDHLDMMDCDELIVEARHLSLVLNAHLDRLKEFGVVCMGIEDMSHFEEGRLRMNQRVVLTLNFGRGEPAP